MYNQSKVHPQQQQYYPQQQNLNQTGQPIYQQQQHYQQQQYYNQQVGYNPQNNQQQYQQVYIHEQHGQKVMQQQRMSQQKLQNQQQDRQQIPQTERQNEQAKPQNYNYQKKSFCSKIINRDISNTIFDQKQIRKAFITKVLCIIACQMLLSTLLCLISIFSEEYRQFLKDNSYFYICAWVISIACCITLYCFRKIAKRVPINYILLLVFTLAESYMLSFHCAFTSPYIVLLACGILFFLVSCLATYAVYTDNDITQKANFFFYGIFAIIGIIIVGVMYPSYLINLAIALVIIFFFSAYIVFDIQRLQGKREMAYAIDDYIIAALDIYIDIVVIFKQLLFLIC